MTSAIKAIETSYAGCRFRSRLEARWAVFFDHLAIHWLYEPQGWVAEGAPYLPDFWLPHQNVWYEIKGVEPLPGYHDRLEGLATFTKRRLILAVGDIPRPDFRHIGYRDPANQEHAPPFYMEVCYPDGSWDDTYAWCRCDVCGATDVQWEGKSERNCKCTEGDRGSWPGAWHPDILAAYSAARAARFEHGEAR